MANFTNAFYKHYIEIYPEIMGVGHNSEQSDGEGNITECEHLMVELSSMDKVDKMPGIFNGIEVRYQKY